jgi:shikimate kinase
VTRSQLRRVLLVGFMGSGKSSIGREVARRLGWRFIDFDEAVEREAGMTVGEIFEKEGEPRFRALEERVGGQLLARSEVVLSSGGGWAAAPGRLTSLPDGTATFWLRVSVPEAIRRASRRPGKRPLLDRPDALEAATRLLAERAPFYAQAQWAVDTERSSVEDVSAGILEILGREYPQSQAV